MYVRVIVHPKSKKEKVEKIKDDTYELQVKEPAEQNLANRRVRELMAEEFGIRVEAVRIVSGHHSHNKILAINKD